MVEGVAPWLIRALEYWMAYRLMGGGYWVNM